MRVFRGQQIVSGALRFYNFTTDFLLKMTLAYLPITPFDFHSPCFCALRGIHNKLKLHWLHCQRLLISGPFKKKRGNIFSNFNILLLDHTLPKTTFWGLLWRPCMETHGHTCTHYTLVHMQPAQMHRTFCAPFFRIVIVSF